MIRTARTGTEPSASDALPTIAARGPYAARGPLRPVPPGTGGPRPARSEGPCAEFRHAGEAAAPGLDYAVSFIPAVTEAVEGASADPGTLLPGMR